MKDECLTDAQEQQPASVPLPMESEDDQYFERGAGRPACALNLPMALVYLARLGQPEVIGAIECGREVVFNLRPIIAGPSKVRNRSSSGMSRLMRSLRRGFCQPANLGSAFSQALRCVYRAPNSRGEALLRAADAGMYRGKVSGKTRIVVHEIHDSPACSPR